MAFHQTHKARRMCSMNIQKPAEVASRTILNSARIAQLSVNLFFCRMQKKSCAMHGEFGRIERNKMKNYEISCMRLNCSVEFASAVVAWKRIEAQMRTNI